MENNSAENKEKKKSLNFLEQIIERDLEEGKVPEGVHTRFPPEPNGYLHIGHAKSICLNFGLANSYKGKCNLRFDDTNPVKEDVEYVDSIKEDVRWLGFDWDDREYFASDYFDQLYDWAVKLITDSKAYVCELDQEDFAKNYRGTITKAGKDSPFRSRSVEENLDIFTRMKNGEFEDGSKVLRAKIDMGSTNMLMRDPAIYRIKHASHHRTGDKWCIYPMYDFAHGQSDYIEGISHSVCTLEFDIHRPLYDWFLEQIIETEYRPHQYEFARLNLTYTIMSKRKLLKLVEGKFVNGWDDPRMPTIGGLRRRGYTPESIRYFADKVGVAKRDNIIDVALLEHSIKEDLNKKAQRVMAILDPVKLIIDNYPEDQVDEMEAVNNPEDENMGKRKVPFSKVLYIERADFMENPPRKFFRLGIDREVRLRYAYIIKCIGVDKDDNGKISAIHCTYDSETRSGSGSVPRKVKGTIHWVSEQHALDAEFRIYDRLFLMENPNITEEGQEFTANVNPDSLSLIQGKIEPFVANTQSGDKFQFERTGYFCTDKDSRENKLVFNRTVPLRDSWAKMNK
jgi:glutaminyl-tRNA synthetase